MSENPRAKALSNLAKAARPVPKVKKPEPISAAREKAREAVENSRSSSSVKSETTPEQLADDLMMVAERGLIPNPRTGTISVPYAQGKITPSQLEEMRASERSRPLRVSDAPNAPKDEDPRSPLLRDRQSLRPDYFKPGESAIINLSGDRSRVGKVYVDGRWYTVPGGADYGLTRGSGLWANAEAPAHDIRDLADELLTRGVTPYGSYLTYGSMGSDSSLPFIAMSRNMMEKQRTNNYRPVTAESIRALDDKIKSISKGGEKLYSDYPGALSPDLPAWLAKSFDRRNAFAQAMGSPTMVKDYNFPDLTAARRSMQDPRLRGLPNEGVVIDDSGRKLYEGFGGHMIGEFDTKATVMPSSTNWLPNKSFPTRVEGFGFGGFDQPVPRSLLFRDTVQKMRDLGKRPDKDYRPFQLAPQVQIIDQEWIDNVGRYLDRANSLGLQDMLISRYDEGGAVESDTQRFRREAEERIAADRQGYLDFIEKRKRLHGNKHPLRQIADQAARGVGSQVLALDDEGNLALPIGSDGIRAPGIYHHALSLPYAVGSMFGAEGSVMDWSQEYDKKAGAINKRVADALDTNVEPRGLPQHLAASAGMMATQVPMRVFGAAKAAHGPLMSAVRAVPEYLGPTIGMPWKQNLAIGTVGGGVLGKLGEMFSDDERPGYNDGGPVNTRTGALVRLGRGIARSIGEGTGYKSVPGKPATVEIPTIGRVETLPIPELEDAAARYMQSVGRPGEHVIREYPEFDEDLARRLSRAYDEMKHDPSDPRVQRSYQALADETMAQLDAIKGSGLDIRFLKPGMEDPYARSPALGYADIIENNRLYTYPTDFGFGSTDANADLLSTFKHPMLTPIGRLGDKDNAVVNDAFRVVHDAFGHFGPGNPFFRHKGEERAWLNHAPMYSPDARPAAAVELRGQNSYLNFGPNAEHNAKASGADTIYADQKLGLMPEWTWTEKSQKKPVQKAEGGEVEQQDDGVAPIREEISSARSLVESGGVDALRAAIESGEVSTVAAIAALHDFSQDDKGEEGFARGGSVGASEYDNMSFNRAFRLARQRALAGGDQVFSWRGKKYGTKLRDEVRQENANRQQRAQAPAQPAPPPSATPAGAQQMPAPAVPVPPGGEVASGATQPLQVTQPRPAPAPRATAQPSAPQGPVLTPVAPAEGDAYQGYPLGMGTRNVQPMPQGSDAVNPPSAGYYGDIDPMASQGGVQLGYPRAQSQYDLDMQRYTGMPYAAMGNAPAFKRGGRVGALSAVARRAAR